MNPETPDQPITVVSTTNKLQTGPIITVLAGIIAVLTAGFLFMQASSATNKEVRVQSDIKTKQARVAELQPTADELDSLTKQSANFHNLFDNQEHWEVVLDQIESRLYKRMRITSIQMNQDSSMTIAGNTENYIDFAKIFRSLTDDSGQAFFISARPTSITKTEAKDGRPANVSFIFSLQLNPKILTAKPQSTQ